VLSSDNEFWARADGVHWIVGGDVQFACESIEIHSRNRSEDFVTWASLVISKFWQEHLKNTHVLRNICWTSELESRTSRIELQSRWHDQPQCGTTVLYESYLYFCATTAMSCRLNR
jgi:hypothetical protein